MVYDVVWIMNLLSFIFLEEIMSWLIFSPRLRGIDERKVLVLKSLEERKEKLLKKAHGEFHNKKGKMLEELKKDKEVWKNQVKGSRRIY